MIKITIGNKEYSLLKVAGAAVAILAGASAVVSYGENISTAWPHIAYKTQAAHDADIAEIYEQHANLENMAEAIERALAGEVKQFRDEWLCDELDDELGELLDKVQAGNATERDRQRITRIRARISPDNLNCARFED